MLTKTSRIGLFLSFLVLLVRPCSAQICMPGAEVKPDSPYSFIREEVKAFKWIRSGLAESQKVGHPYIAPDDPQRVHKTVELYTVLHNVEDAYTCAESLLKPFKDSKNDYVHGSVDSLLTAIQGTKDNNVALTTMIEALNKATKPEDIDQTEIGKTLANIKSAQHDVMMLMMAGAKMSTFGILKIEGEGDDSKPTAFTITPVQHAKLLAEVTELAKNKSSNYVDNCADILLNALNLKLPMSSN